MSSNKCPFCSRIFSKRSAYSRHVALCKQSVSSSSEELSLITEISNMSLDNEQNFSNIEEVKN